MNDNPLIFTNSLYLPHRPCTNLFSPTVSTSTCRLPGGCWYSSPWRHTRSESRRGSDSSDHKHESNQPGRQQGRSLRDTLCGRKHSIRKGRESTVKPKTVSTYYINKRSQREQLPQIFLSLQYFLF